MNQVTKNILSLLNEKGISANKLQVACGLPNNAITNWKKGFANPSAKALEKIADYFNLPISYFYEDHEEIKKALPKINEVTLSQEEQELFNLILSLTDEEVQELSSFVDYIISKRNK